MLKLFKQKIWFILFELFIVGLLAYLLIYQSFPARKTFYENTGSAPTNSTSTKNTIKEAASSSIAQIATTTKKEEPVPLEKLTIRAKAAIVYEVNTGKVLYDFNKDEMLPIASITKLMTAYTASLFIPSDAVITIRPQDAETESSAGIIAGERWDLKNLIAFTLVTSSNGGASALANEAQNQSQANFVIKMNEIAKEIGLRSTAFRNETGLDIYNNQLSGSYSTPQDIATLYSFIFKNDPTLLENTNKGYLTTYSLDNVKHQAVNTNQIINKIPGLISSKTGTTDLAGGNLAVVFNASPNNPVVAVILGSSAQGRFSEMEKLVRSTISHFTQKAL